jgi:hypothetical protein
MPCMPCRATLSALVCAAVPHDVDTVLVVSSSLCASFIRLVLRSVMLLHAGDACTSRVAMHAVHAPYAPYVYTPFSRMCIVIYMLC